VRRGARVTLIDPWGPGNARASSGGDTRVIRATYGSHRLYTALAVRALELWRQYDARWGAGLLQQTGALWLFGRDQAFGRASIDALATAGAALDELDVDDARRKYPQICFDGITLTLFEPQAGVLSARRACEHVVERFVAEGGTYRTAAAAVPGAPAGGTITLADGRTLEADAFVFACGPWLGSIFPDVVGALVTATRQEVYYFGTPAADARFDAGALPVWLDAGERFIYGIPGAGGRGFKVADDTPGDVIDPTSAERRPTEAGLAAIRDFLARRFPLLRKAPLIASEVCQYESTPDAGFIIDCHPAAANVWIVGGGSGHGFKMGPAVGELAAGLVLGEAPRDPRFALARFATPPPGGWAPKWG
jgi:glycine/D-amino acid oxidase-like deaminating enzyme